MTDLSAGGGLVCVADDDNRVFVWDLETWQPPVCLEVDKSGVRARRRTVTAPNPIVNQIRRLRRVGKSTDYVEIEIAPGGEWLAISIGKVVHVVKPKTWQHITTLNFSEDVDGTMAEPQGKWLAVAVGETIQYWTSETWTHEAEFTDHHQTGFANAGAWSPDGSLLATVSDKGTLRIQDGNDWSERTEFRLDSELTGCAWLTNDRLVAVGGHGVYWFTYLLGDPE